MKFIFAVFTVTQKTEEMMLISSLRKMNEWIIKITRGMGEKQLLLLANQIVFICFCIQGLEYSLLTM